METKSLENYQNYGRVMVTKRDALRKTPVSGAVFGIYLRSQFREADWANSIKNPIQTKTAGTNGQVTFDSSKLRIFDDSGIRIPYVIAEITPPTGYLPSYNVLTTTLTEGKTITTVNGEAIGAPLIIEDEPKLTIRDSEILA